MTNSADPVDTPELHCPGCFTPIKLGQVQPQAAQGAPPEQSPLPPQQNPLPPEQSPPPQPDPVTTAIQTPDPAAAAHQQSPLPPT